eukprot:26152-Pleurochrysis_carterae.AAC.4
MESAASRHLTPSTQGAGRERARRRRAFGRKRRYDEMKWRSRLGSNRARRDSDANRDIRLRLTDVRVCGRALGGVGRAR